MKFNKENATYILSLNTDKEVTRMHNLLFHFQMFLQGKTTNLPLLLITIPATWATCEWSFSSLKRLKSYLWNTMSYHKFMKPCTLTLLPWHGNRCEFIGLYTFVSMIKRKLEFISIWRCKLYNYMCLIEGSVTVVRWYTGMCW